MKVTYEPPLTEEKLVELATQAKRLSLSWHGVKDWVRFLRPERTYDVAPGTLSTGINERRLSVQVGERSVPVEVNRDLANGECEVTH